jgi:hypothetical protein
MPVNSTVPGHYDPIFLRNSAKVYNNFGSERNLSGGLDLVYPVADYDAMQAAIARYPVEHLAIELPERVDAIVALRKVKMEAFQFMGMTIGLDPDTRGNLTGACLGLMRSPDIPHIDWQVTPGMFVAIPREVVMAMADSAFRYIQACFTHARVLTDAVQAAKDINELAAIDINKGWPQDAVPVPEGLPPVPDLPPVDPDPVEDPDPETPADPPAEEDPQVEPPVEQPDTPTEPEPETPADPPEEEVPQVEPDAPPAEDEEPK